MLLDDWFSEELDAQVPTRRRHARAVKIVVHYEDSTSVIAILLVRIKYERGGGRHWYRLCSIDDIREFYPKEMGREVIEDVLARWTEKQLTPPRHRTWGINYEEY